jgi:hypothetical protein
MAKRKLKTAVTTEELGKLIADEISTWTPEQKAAARAALRGELGPTAAEKIKDRFDKMTAGNQKYKN